MGKQIPVSRLRAKVDRERAGSELYAAISANSQCRPPRNYIALSIYCEMRDIEEASGGTEINYSTRKRFGEASCKSLRDYVEGFLFESE